MLTRYAMHGFELVEKLSRRPDFPLFRLFQSLSNAFLSIGEGSNIEQALVGFSVLHDSRSLPLHGEHHRAPSLLKLLHEVAGTAPKGRQRLDIFGDVEHGCSPNSTFLGAIRIPYLCGPRYLIQHSQLIAFALDFSVFPRAIIFSFASASS